MKLFLIIAQIVTTVCLVGVILLQVKGTGLGSAFGGSGELYQSRRGVEKIIFSATIILSVAFAVLSLLLIIFP